MGSQIRSLNVGELDVAYFEEQVQRRGSLYGQVSPLNSCAHNNCAKQSCGTNNCSSNGCFTQSCSTNNVCFINSCGADSCGVNGGPTPGE